MILPTTYPAVLLLLVLSLLCLGSWANTQKLAGKWRFELYYYDYSVGAAVCAVAAAFTLGSMNSQELTFQDNLLITSRHALAYGFGAGMVFNLANILLLGAMQVAGMSVAFPITFGIALVIGTVWNYFSTSTTNAMLVFSGAILTMAAVITVAVAHSGHLRSLREIKTALRPDPRFSRGPRPPSAAAGIALSILSGILMSLYAPLSDNARAGETGLGPYSAALLFGVGVLMSTFLYTPFFLNFPVQGSPVQLTNYFRGTKKQHLLGLLGGIVWMVGTLAAYAGTTGSSGGQASIEASPALSFALGQSVPLLAALWGVLAWREFQGATVRVKMLLTATLVLYAAGITLLALVPLYSKS